MEDKRIVELFWQRSDDAVAETQRVYGKRLTAQALRILGSAQDAEECVNDALLRAWNAIPPHRPEALGAFLAKIVRGLAIDRLRAREADKRGGGEYLFSLEELSECVGGTETAFDEGTLTDTIGDYLRTLSPEARWMFLRRYFDFESIKDIARAANCTQSKVKSTLARARKGLRAYLKKEGFDL